MDGLYQSPPYLPQQQHHQQMYRSNFHSIEHNHHHEMDPWSPPHHQPPPLQQQHHNSIYNNNNNIMPRPKITTNVWEDEGTLCFQVDAKGICVARRQDNDMINGTKLLNVVGMSRGKRDGILKNEKGRVVVKVGAMHLKGVWIPFNRATELAEKFKILDVLYPLFVDEPSIYLCSSMSASHNNEVIPSPPATTKCNLASPLPAFRSTEDYSTNTNTNNNNNNINNNNNNNNNNNTNWQTRPYNMMNPNHYDHVLHRNHHHNHHHQESPIPRSNYHHPSPTDDNNMYLLNNDYYNQRQFNHHHNNRGSFSSVSSHQSYLYPSLHHEDESKNSSVTTPTSFIDNNLYNNGYSRSVYTASSPYIKSSPYTNTSIHIDPINNNNKSAGSATPSSWLSPETPTAVLFQQKDKDQNVISKKRKASCDSIDIKTKLSPSNRATRKLRLDSQQD